MAATSFFDSISRSMADVMYDPATPVADYEKEKLLLNDNERTDEVLKKNTNNNKSIKQEVSDFPGNRRLEKFKDRMLQSQIRGPPSDSIFIKTGGNALQAVSKKTMEELQQDKTNACVCIIIPNNVLPGQSMYVSTPDNHRIVSITVPGGYYPGRALLVKIPPEEERKQEEDYNTEIKRTASGTTTTVVQGQDINSAELFLRESCDNNDTDGGDNQYKSEIV